MSQAGRTNRTRALRHAAPERVREMLDAYRRRAARDVLPHPARSGDGTSQGTGRFARRRTSSLR
jgi:hypothetical protein